MASRSESGVSTDHDEIKRWAEERGARPSCVRGTGGKGDIGMLRLDFPGFSGEDSLEHIEWDEWFEKFDERGLALLYQETTASGEKSNFNKIVNRETAAESGRKSSARKSASKSAQKKASSSARGKSASKKPPAKKAAAKKTAVKKTALKKTAGKKTGTKKTPAKKATRRSIGAEKTSEARVPCTLCHSGVRNIRLPGCD